MASTSTIGLALIASVLAAVPAQGQEDTMPRRVPKCDLVAQVIDRGTLMPIVDSEILLFAEGVEIVRLVRHDTAAFHVELPNLPLVEIRVSARGYLLILDMVNPAEQSEDTWFIKEYHMTKLTICGPWRSIPEVDFPRNSAVLSNSGRDSLSVIEIVLRENPTIIMEVRGNVDIMEKDAIAMERCEVVRKHLIDRGIHEGRLVINTRGRDDPFVSESQIEVLATKEEKEAAHAMNRRVEFRVLSFDWVPEQDTKPDEER